jgi:hypothetical protein
VSRKVYMIKPYTNHTITFHPCLLDYQTCSLEQQRQVRELPTSSLVSIGSQPHKQDIVGNQCSSSWPLIIIQKGLQSNLITHFLLRVVFVGTYYKRGKKVTSCSYRQMEPIWAVISSKPDDAPGCIQEDETQCQEGYNKLKQITVSAYQDCRD